MSTQLINDAGDVVGTRFHGGDRGPVAQVMMPASIAKLAQDMRVHEDTRPDLVTTLGEWTRDMETRGRTIIHGVDVVGAMRDRQRGETRA